MLEDRPSSEPMVETEGVETLDCDVGYSIGVLTLGGNFSTLMLTESFKTGVGTCGRAPVVHCLSWIRGTSL